MSAGGAGFGDTLSMLARMVAGQLGITGTFGQFNPNQNIQDTVAGQRFAQTSMTATMYSASHSNAAAEVNKLLTQLTGHPSAITNNYLSAGINNYVMPMASVMGAGLFDQMGLSAPMFTSALAGQLRFNPAVQSGDPAAMGQRIGEIGAGAYNQLFNSTTGNPLQNTYGYRGGQLGMLAAWGATQGWEKDLMGMSKEGAIKEHAEFSQRMGMLGSSVRDLGGAFAGLNAQQTGEMSNVLSLGGDHMSIEQKAVHNRLMFQLGRSADMAPQQWIGLQAQAGQYARSIGLEASAGTVSSARALADRNVLKYSGEQAINDTGASLDEMTQQSHMLTSNAMNSTAGKQMAGLAAIAARLKKKGIKPHGKLGEAIDALEKGEYQYQDMGAFTSMGGADISAKELEAAATDPSNVKIYGRGVANNARNEQWRLDLAPQMSTMIANNLGQASKGKLGQRQGDQISEAITEVLHNSGGKTQQEAQDAIKNMLVQKFRMSADDANKYMQSAWQAADIFTQQVGYKGILNAVDMNQKRAVETEIKRANAAADNAAENAATGQMDVVQRVVEGFKHGGVQGALQGLVGFISGDTSHTPPTAAQIKDASSNPARNAPSLPGKPMHEAANPHHDVSGGWAFGAGAAISTAISHVL
jgi:hypothetical protein